MFALVCSTNIIKKTNPINIDSPQFIVSMLHPFDVKDKNGKMKAPCILKIAMLITYS